MNLQLLLKCLRPDLIITMDFGDGVAHAELAVFELTDLMSADPNGFASSYPENVRAIREDADGTIALIF